MKTCFLVLSTIAAITMSSGLQSQIEPTNDERNITEEMTVSKKGIIQKSAIMMMGIECRTSNAPEAGPVDIPNLWEKFFKKNIIGQIPNKTSSEVFALYCDYEGDYTQPYTVVIGCPVSSLDEVPQGMVAKIIPAGSYVLFEAIGEHPKSLIDTWGNIWQQHDLKRTYTGDYEVYGNRFSDQPQVVEVYIAIECKDR